MSAPTRKKAKRISEGQPAASEPEVFLYEGGGQVSRELRKSLTRVRVGPQVKAIPNGAFFGCKELVEMKLNEGLQTIGDYAFHRCTSLREVTLPSSVTELGDGAFFDCSGLIEMQFNEGLEVIGEGAFQGCTALRSVTISSSVTELRQWVFYGCSGLIELHLNEGLRTIGQWAFEDCSALRSLTIPSSVTKLFTGAFYGCSNLSEVRLLGGERLLNQEFFDYAFWREEQGILNQEAIDEMLFSFNEFDEDVYFVFRDCPLPTIKISISWAVSERMARLPRECRLTVEERIHNLNLLELQQDDNVLACFPVVRMTPNEESEDDSEDEVEDDTFEVRDTNRETARSLYGILQMIAFYELKESSVVIELAMWKSRIDGEPEESRADCRVAIPDPAKSLIMEYGGFAGFLEPVIEGA